MGPYRTESDGTLTYVGNKVFDGRRNALTSDLSENQFLSRVDSLHSDRIWRYIYLINDQIHAASVEYFQALGARFVPLPLITRMISSPGALYGRERISYTTDTSPIALTWFDSAGPAFLAESSQIYLELSLLVEGVDQVYCIYNSFRKEPCDATHLPEFRHIEYEGHVDQLANKQIALRLVFYLIDRLLEHPSAPLEQFLTQGQIANLATLKRRTYEVTFAEALEALYLETNNQQYKQFTLKHFGPWEEVKLTEIYGGMVLVNQFPLLEVPFYHAEAKSTGPNGERTAESCDFLWPGYREIIGSGLRIKSLESLEEKAVLFELPREDYQPYLSSRRLEGYRPSSGFGLGWERLIQGLLCMPFIYSAVPFPRTHLGLRP